MANEHEKVHVICENLCLEEGMTKEQIESTYATQQTVSALASGSPKGIYSDSAALKVANPDTGVYIASGNGHIYSWTKNQSGDPIDLGVYQAAEDSETVENLNNEIFREITNILDVSDFDYNGFYSGNGTYYTSDVFGNITCAIEYNKTYYTNLKLTGLDLVYFDNQNNRIQSSTLNNGIFIVPNNSRITKVSIPIRKMYLHSVMISETKLPIFCDYVQYGKTINVNRVMDNDNNEFLNLLKNNITEINSDGNYDLFNVGNGVDIRVKKLTGTLDASKWRMILFNTIKATMCTNSFIIIAINSDYALAFATSNNKFYKLNLSNSGNTVVETMEIEDLRTKKINVEIKNKHFVISDFYNNVIYLDYDISDYIDENTILSLGTAYLQNSVYFRDICALFNNTHFVDYNYGKQLYNYAKQLDNLIQNYHDDLLKINHWKNKVWYAYGTSVTNIDNEGKYARHLANFSGLNLNNKGISGGGIANSGHLVRDAVMNTTDGKLNADLITLEVGFNDGSVPIGDIYDNNTNSFCGCLNQCIRYLQQNTNAQIVVISSPMGWKTSSISSGVPIDINYTLPNGLTYYQFAEYIKKVCQINSTYFVDLRECSNYSYSRIYNNPSLCADGIHPTDLGGYNIAQYIWSELKNIPLWYTEIPEDTN